MLVKDYVRTFQKHLPSFFQPRLSLEDFVLPPHAAVQELRKRQSHLKLRQHVFDYLSGDIPAYFDDGPVIYTARYIASPNFEMLRFIHLTEPLGLPVVITEDAQDIFVPQNNVKKALCKLPICSRITQDGPSIYELYENISIVDINHASGKRLCDIRTLWNEPLVDFHSAILATYIRGHAHVYSDTSWIDRNGRGNLIELYKRFLSLFLVHGVLFEDYVLDGNYEEEFVGAVLRPAFEYVENRFGMKPLIAALLPTSVESSNFWSSYPSEIGKVIKQRMAA